MRSRLLLPLLFGLITVVSSCADGYVDATAASTTTSASTTTGASLSSTTTTVAPGFPVSIASASGETVIEEMPQRIAVLSAPLVEIVFAVGAGEQVMAVDLFSNYPAEVMALEQVDSFALNLESVAALDPDLVILSFDPGEVVDGLSAIGIPVLLFGTPATLDEVYAQIELLGTATGRTTESAALIELMTRDIETIVAEVGDSARGLKVYHETDQFSFYTPNSASFIGHLYERLGMENIADAAPDEFGSGFPQLSPEYIIASNPDIVFLAAFGETVESFASRPGWDTLSAVRAGNVFLLDNDIASRWGPRVIDLMEAIASGIEVYGSR